MKRIFILLFLPISVLAFEVPDHEYIGDTSYLINTSPADATLDEDYEATIEAYNEKKSLLFIGDEISLDPAEQTILVPLSTQGLDNKLLGTLSTSNGGQTLQNFISQRVTQTSTDFNKSEFIDLMTNLEVPIDTVVSSNIKLDMDISTEAFEKRKYEVEDVVDSDIYNNLLEKKNGMNLHIADKKEKVRKLKLKIEGFRAKIDDWKQYFIDLKLALETDSNGDGKIDFANLPY